MLGNFTCNLFFKNELLWKKYQENILNQEHWEQAQLLSGHIWVHLNYESFAKRA